MSPKIFLLIWAVKNALSPEPFTGLRRNTGMNTEPNTARPAMKIKSPLTLARTALASAQEALPLYSSKFSRHDFTQHQLYALLALRRYFKTDYRGLEAMVRDWSELRAELGLKRVPDHSTLQRAARRLHAEARPICGREESMPLFDRPSPASENAA